MSFPSASRIAHTPTHAPTRSREVTHRTPPFASTSVSRVVTMADVDFEPSENPVAAAKVRHEPDSPTSGTRQKPRRVARFAFPSPRVAMRARAFVPSVRIPPTLTARPSLVDTRAVMSQAAATKTKKAPLGDVNSNAAPKDVAPAGSKKSVEQIYQKKTQLEHLSLIHISEPTRPY